MKGRATKFISIIFIGLIIFFTTSLVSAVAKFDIGAERFYDGVKHNPYQLKVSDLSYEYNPKYSNTSYKFKAWDTKDIHSANISAIVYSDGYVTRVMIDYYLNNNLQNSQVIFDKSLWACINALGIPPREQAWLSSHWIAGVTTNETESYITEVIRDNGALLRVVVLYHVPKAHIIGIIVEL